MMIKLKRIFRQSRPGYCGPAALLSVLRFYGLGISEHELVRRCRATIDKGTNHKNIIRGLRSLGWHGFWKENGTISELRYFIKQNKPVVVDWFAEDDGHYSVVIGLDRKFIYLADPEEGKKRKILISKFKKIWFDFEGDSLKEAKKIYFEWFLTPTLKRVQYKIKGHYF